MYFKKIVEAVAAGALIYRGKCSLCGKVSPKRSEWRDVLLWAEDKHPHALAESDYS